MKQQFVLVTDLVRQNAIRAIQQAEHGARVSIAPRQRTLPQNARMWSMLTEVADQVMWHGQRLTPENWKDVFTAALKRQQVVPGLDGGFVVLGTSTSRMTVAEMGDLMELMSAFAAEQGVRFSAAEAA